jgi:hypothetical protein
VAADDRADNRQSEAGTSLVAGAYPGTQSGRLLVAYTATPDSRSCEALHVLQSFVDTPQNEKRVAP